MRIQKLLTKELEKKLRRFPLRSQDGSEDQTVVAKFFFPYGRGTWFVTEYDPESGDCFGFVESMQSSDLDEWGYFNVQELQNSRTRQGWQAVERDILFGEQPMSKACPKALERLV